MEKSILEAKAERYVGGPKLDDEMFQTYRQGGGLDTDTDTGFYKFYIHAFNVVTIIYFFL